MSKHSVFANKLTIHRTELLFGVWKSKSRAKQRRKFEMFGYFVSNEIGLVHLIVSGFRASFRNVVLVGQKGTQTHASRLLYAPV